MPWKWIEKNYGQLYLASCNRHLNIKKEIKALNFSVLLLTKVVLIWSGMAQYLNVEKWGWDFSTLSGEATKVEKEFSPWVMNGLAGVVKKNFPMSGEAASGEILFWPQLLSHEWRMGKITHPHFSTLRDLHFHIERENFTTKGGKDLFYPQWWHQG